MTEIKSCTTCEECKKEYHDKRGKKEEERFGTILSLYEIFHSTLEENTKQSILLNKGLVYLVVKSYFDDIYRFKDYSGSELADQHKQAAYIIKWISKLRPIQILVDTDFNNEMVWINSSFAIYVGLNFLHVQNIFEYISDSLYENLLYSTQYRNISGKQLATLMYTIELNALTRINIEKK